MRATIMMNRTGEKMGERCCISCTQLFAVLLLSLVCGIVSSDDSFITPYCDGFLTLSHEAPSLHIRAPSVPIGYGHSHEVNAALDEDDACVWYFHAPVDSVIKLEVIDLELQNNESVRVFDGLGEKFGPGKKLRSEVLDHEFVSTRNSISIVLKTGKFFEGSAVFQLTIQDRKASSHGVFSVDPAQCGGTVHLDSTTPTQRFNATNQEPGAYPAYCTWHVVAPASTIVRLRFINAALEYYDNFMVADGNGARLADFYNINIAPYDVLSNSNEIVCLFAAYMVQSSSFVHTEVSFIDVSSSPALDENAVHQLSGGHLMLTGTSPSVTIQSTNFTGAASVYAGSYYYVTSPPGTRIKVDFLNVDTGAGVYLDVRSDYNTPLTSVSGDLDLQPVVSLNNFLIIWFSSQWRNPGVGVTLKVSVQDDSVWDSGTTLSSCGGSVDLNRTTSGFLTFSSPHYGTDIAQYTICYWYFTSPLDHRVALEFNDIQTENSYVYVFDSVNAPSVTVSSISGEVSLTPFHSSSSGVSVLFNDFADTRNGRGLLAKASIIDQDVPPSESSCGGQIFLNASDPTRAFRSPWYDAPTGVLAYTNCYWYVTCSPEDRVVTFEILDLETTDASLDVYDTATTSLQQQLASLKGQSSGSYGSSGPGMAVRFADLPSSYADRGFSGQVSISDPYTWTDRTVLTSCGASITMDATSPPLTISSPSYADTQPDGVFDCRWYFTGTSGMDFVLEFINIDVSQTTSISVFDGADTQIAELSGNGLSTTALTSHSSLILRFYDTSTTDVEPGFLAKVTIKDPPSWDSTRTLDSCGGGIPLSFASRSFMFTTPNYPSTKDGHFDCRWYVRSPSDTVIAVEIVDFGTADVNSYLSVRDGATLYDPELVRLSGSPSISFPSSLNATTNNMVVHFFSDRATIGRGASIRVTFIGGEQPTSDVRLVGGSGPHEGRVELYHEHAWGTVCDDGWGQEDAMVVCKMLGYRTVINVWPRAHFGAGTGQIWLDDLHCSGQEKHLTDCPHSMPTGTNNCGHSEDAGVTCGQGADVICDGNSMTVFIDRVLLEHGDGATDVHLLDASCRGYDHDGVQVAVSTSFDRCGTQMEETDEVITFTNLITYFQPRSRNGEKITRDDRLCVPVTCTFNRHQLAGNSYRPQLGLVSFSETGYQNFSLELALYEDAAFDSRMPEGAELLLDEHAYFGVNLTAVTDLTVMVESCWATPHPYPFDPVKYRIIDNGCALDSSVTYYDDVIGNPLLATFSVNAFAFVGEFDQVYMHCEVLVCDNTDPDSRCEQGCISRARRAASSELTARRGSSSRPHTISNGPISPSRSRRASGGRSSAHSTTSGKDNTGKMIAMGVSGVLLAAGVMIAYVTSGRGHRSKARRYRQPSAVDRKNQDGGGDEKVELLDTTNDPNVI